MDLINRIFPSNLKELFFFAAMFGTDADRTLEKSAEEKGEFSLFYFTGNESYDQFEYF